MAPEAVKESRGSPEAVKLGLIEMSEDTSGGITSFEYAFDVLFPSFRTQAAP